MESIWLKGHSKFDESAPFPEKDAVGRPKMERIQGLLLSLISYLCGSHYKKTT
jgi:hypothetical protein